MRLVCQPGQPEELDVSIKVSRPSGVAEVTIGGELGVAAVPQLRSCLADLVSRGETLVVVDLSEVTLCDSTALGAFVGAHRRISASGGHIELRNPPSALRNLLSVSGLDRVLHVT